MPDLMLLGVVFPGQQLFNTGQQSWYSLNSQSFGGLDKADRTAAHLR
jgi:hypothetical protein